MKAKITVALAILAALALGLGIGCRRDENQPTTILTPYFRLVDPDLQATGSERALEGPLPTARGAAALPTGTLDNDTRYVLPGVEHEGLVYVEQTTVGSEGWLAFHPPLPPKLREAKRLLVQPQIKVEGKLWTRPPFEAEIVEKNGTRTAVIVPPLSDIPAGTTIGFFVEGYAKGPNGEQPHRTALLRIPNGAVLEFAIGIAEPAWNQGAAVFQVEACQGETCESLYREEVDPRDVSTRKWQKRQISLERFAGSERTFQFTSRAAGRQPGALSLPLWANPTIYAPALVRDDAPNVILLSIDTLAAKHVTAYGSVHDTTPFITETFEKNGVVFDNCVAAAATTPPSHMTMFTSVQPCVHGLRTGFEVIPDWIVTLGETLRGAGIETGAVTEDGWLGISHGFGRGFNTYVENTSPDVMEPLGQIDLTFGKAAAWLDANKNKRFFLFLHTFQVHDPYSPPIAYRDLYAKDVDLIGAENRPMRDRINYDREIRYTDDQLRELFSTITALKLDDRTVFLLTSDHGEEFFEHGVWGHGGTLYQEVTHVPLMAWGPGRIARGRRIAEPVAHIDILPTILGLANVPVPAQASGRDLSEVLKDPEPHLIPTRPLFTEAWAEIGYGPGYELVDFERPAYMVQVGSDKLIRFRRHGDFVYERYDLAKDPDEAHNVYSAGSPGDSALQAAVDGYDDACQALAEQMAHSAGHQTEKAATVPLSPEQAEKLRALGYID